jgi:O-antigen ligase
MNQATRLPGWLVPAAATAVGVTFVAGILVIDHPGAVALPAALLAFAFALSRLFRNPIELYAGFLLVIVNLDHFKISEALSLDVAVSSAALLLLLLRAAVVVPRTVSACPAVERWLIVFLAAAGISVLVSTFPTQSIKRYGRELEYLAIVFLLLRHPLTRTEIRWLLGATLVASIVPCVLGLAGYAMRIESLLGQGLHLENLYGSEPRVRSTLSHPVVFSIYLSVVLTFTLGLWMAGKVLPRGLTGPIAALQMVTLYVTYGRTGWIGFAAGFAALLWLQGRKKLLLLGAPVLPVLAWRVVPNFQERWETVLSATGENSLLWRLGLWDYALRIYPERPVFGSGIGTFLEYVDYLQGFNAHQTWVGLLIETGLVGTLAFLGLLLVVGRELLRAARRAVPEERPVAQGAVAVWFGLLAASLASEPFGMPSAAVYVWTLFAVALNLPGTRDPRSHAVRSG